MRQSWSFFSLIGLLWWSAPPQGPHVVRVLTYNIHHGEGVDGVFDLPRLARIIESREPDLVALQEVDQGTARASGVNELNELARLTHLHAAFGKAMDFQGGGYGVGVLSRWPIRHAEIHPLPGSPDREPRTSLTVSVRINKSGPNLQFTTTHLDQGRETVSRVAQANELNERLVRADDTPAILAGDLNSVPDTEVMRILGSDWSTVSPVTPPSPATPFGRRVDHVLVRPFTGWRVLESTVVDAPVASDHRPVLVVLEWTGDTRIVATRH